MQNKVIYYIAPHLGKDENGDNKWLTDEFDLFENEYDALNRLKEIEEKFLEEFKNKKEIYSYNTYWIDNHYLKTEFQLKEHGYVYSNTYIVFKVYKQIKD